MFYGKTYLNEEVEKKMFRRLAKSWEAKVTAIEEAKNLETLTLDKLIGSLLTHEMRLNEGLKKPKLRRKRLVLLLNPPHIKIVNQNKNGSSKQKLKANMATWSDEDSFDEEDQEVANLCLMPLVTLR
ncbi:UBN2 domain-containing protein [Gossypium australe]|uniref:UBN2 domain-containing protein n=1 Tax=Gossypium australe TaxID=47621 RepID=A0A5B6VYS6_9ROSI|nr:UBN2 domain-containing protein [Gossypium australe]